MYYYKALCSFESDSKKFMVNIFLKATIKDLNVNEAAPNIKKNIKEYFPDFTNHIVCFLQKINKEEFSPLLERGTLGRFKIIKREKLK